MSANRIMGRWDDHEWIVDVRTVDEYITSLESWKAAREKYEAEKKATGVHPWREEAGHHPRGLEPRWDSILPDAIKTIGDLRERIEILEATSGSEKA